MMTGPERSERSWRRQMMQLTNPAILHRRWTRRRRQRHHAIGDSLSRHENSQEEHRRLKEERRRLRHRSFALRCRKFKGGRGGFLLLEGDGGGTGARGARAGNRVLIQIRVGLLHCTRGMDGQGRTWTLEYTHNRFSQDAKEVYSRHGVRAVHAGDYF